MSTQATARGHHELPGVSGGSPGGAPWTGNKVLLERGARRARHGAEGPGPLGSCAHRVPHRVDSTPGLPLLSWGDRPGLGSKTAASRDSPESLPEPADQDQLEHGGGRGHRPGLWGARPHSSPAPATRERETAASVVSVKRDKKIEEAAGGGGGAQLGYPGSSASATHAPSLPPPRGAVQG